MHPVAKVILWGVSLFALAWAGLAAFQLGRFPFQTGLLLLVVGQGAVSFLANPLAREALGWNRLVFYGLVVVALAISSSGYVLAEKQMRSHVAVAMQTAAPDQQQAADNNVHQVPETPSAPQAAPAPKPEAALPTAAHPGFTMKDRPCGIGPHFPSIERAGQAGDWQYYVALAIDSQKGYDSLWDRIYLCTKTGAGAPGPYIRLELWSKDDKPMSIARENFEIPVGDVGHLPTTGSSVHTLPSGLIDVQFERNQWVATMGRSMASDQFSCDTNWCHVAIYKDFMEDDMIDGKSVKMTISNDTKDIGHADLGVDGYAKARQAAEKVWRELRAGAGPRHVRILSAKEEEARDKRIKDGTAGPAPDSAPVEAPAAPPPSPSASAVPPPAAAAPKPAAPPPPPANVKASFSCASAVAPGRKLVCSDASIASLDLTVAAMYRRALNVAADPRAIQADQAMFNAKRDSCTTRACVQSALAERKRELADWQ